MKELTELFKALSDENRLRILALLMRHGELCVCKVEQKLAFSQSKSSRHLRILLAVGLVENRREGQWMHYRLTDMPDGRRELLLSTLRRLLPASEIEFGIDGPTTCDASVNSGEVTQAQFADVLNGGAAQ